MPYQERRKKTMNKMEKNSMYDELCRTLTEYEEQREPIKGLEWSWEDEL